MSIPKSIVSAADLPENSTESLSQSTLAENALVHKITLRLLPFLFFLYVIAYVDRVNVGFAKLQMNELPWLKVLSNSETIYGVASGIFFIGYFLFEIPSNLILQRVGARVWITRIMITWGIIACAMLWVNSVSSFYTLRFLLGIAEAGFFPGVLLYLTYWFTAKERARVIALFMTANAVSYIFGGPLSGWILSQPARVLPLLGSLAPYQQMFLFEGIPAILMGFVVLWYLPSSPKEAAWLNSDERDLIESRLANEAPAIHAQHPPLWKTWQNPQVMLLCAIFTCLVLGMYGISLWMPQMIKNFGNLSDLQVGLITAIPYLCAGIAMVLNGIHSDKTQERRWHIASVSFIGMVGLIVCAFAGNNPVVGVIGLTLAAAGMWSILGPFWALAPPLLRGGGALAVASGLALINSVGNLGGFIGPFIIGYVKSTTGSFVYGLLILAGLVLLGGLLALRVPKAVETAPKL